MKKFVLTVVVVFFCLSAYGCGTLFLNATTIGSILPQEKDRDGGDDDVGNCAKGDALQRP